MGTIRNFLNQFTLFKWEDSGKAELSMFNYQPNDCSHSVFRITMYTFLPSRIWYYADYGCNSYSLRILCFEFSYSQQNFKYGRTKRK